MDTAGYPFTDVSEDDWYYKAVLWAAANGITSGTDATHFSPSKTCTRAEVVTFLRNAAGKPNEECGSSVLNPFTDVKETDWYYNSVLWAIENQITAGTSAQTFSPNLACTRAQIVTFLYRYME